MDHGSDWPGFRRLWGCPGRGPQENTSHLPCEWTSTLLLGNWHPSQDGKVLAQQVEAAGLDIALAPVETQPSPDPKTWLPHFSASLSHMAGGAVGRSWLSFTPVSWKGHRFPDTQPWANPDAQSGKAEAQAPRSC